MQDKVSELNKLPATRAQALREGETFFFTGVPCKHGHIDKRYTTSAQCHECNRLRYENDRLIYQQARQRKLEAALRERRES